MSRVEEYRARLRTLGTSDWPQFLTERSGLPGPRANIELGQAVAEEADLATLNALIATNDEFLLFCGVIGLGRVLAEGGNDDLDSVPERLHTHAGDERWRVREAVAMAMQRLGTHDPTRMVELVDAWAADPDPLVQRAAVASICEPRLLHTPAVAEAAIRTCERVTTSLAARAATERRDPSVRTLRQGLGYCWSVAVAADPGRGLPRFLALSTSSDPDVRWLVRENRRKSRLANLL